MTQASQAPAPSRATATPAAPVPRTREEFDALQMRRSELNNQMSSITQLRGQLMQQQLLSPDAGTKRELRERMQSLDQRSARIEQEILAADDAIAAGIAAGLTVGGPRTEVITLPPSLPPLFSMRDMIVVNAGSVALMAVLFWVIVRRRLRATPVPAIADQSRRLEQLQQAVDTMAVEVERVSEGQRYVTKLLTDRMQPAVGAGEATGRSS